MRKEAIVTCCALLLLLPGTPQLSWYDPEDAGYVTKLPHAETERETIKEFNLMR